MRTPYYYYNIPLLQQTLEAIQKEAANFRNCKVHYAIKANPNRTLLQYIHEAGLGVDCVSGGEIRTAKELGFKAGDMVFAGVGKSDEEIDLALASNIYCFNVESLEELKVIGERAACKNKVAHVAMRVNPNIDAHTHANITTGLAENKFGIEMSMLPDVVKYALSHPHLTFEGLHFHIGSQILTLEPYMELCNVINGLQEDFRSEGIQIRSINVGGGLGVDYNSPRENPIPDFKGFFGVFRERLKLSDNQSLHFELGRSVVAQCGSLITKVLYVKQGTCKKFAIVDAGFTDLIRPALYGAHHKIENMSNPDGATALYDVVGPICESTDVFAKDYTLAETKRGDYLAIRSAGAYGECMSMTYNLRRLPASGTRLLLK